MLAEHSPFADTESRQAMRAAQDKSARGLLAIGDPGFAAMIKEPSLFNAAMLGLGVTPVGRVLKGAKAFKKFKIEGKAWWDNPGGEWLEHQRKRADTIVTDRYPTSGEITAGVKARMSPEELRRLPGESGEHLHPPGRKYNDLMKSIREKGYLEKIDGYDNRPLIMVNHRGEPYISEGNNRIRAAFDSGIDEIPVEIRYRAGGEALPGPFHLKTLIGE